MAIFYYMNGTIGSSITPLANITTATEIMFLNNDNLENVTCYVTTSAPHGLVAGQSIYIKDCVDVISPTTLFDGSTVVYQVVSPTQFTYLNAWWSVTSGRITGTGGEVCSFTLKNTGPEDVTNYYSDIPCTIPKGSIPNPSAGDTIQICPASVYNVETFTPGYMPDYSGVLDASVQWLTVRRDSTLAVSGQDGAFNPMGAAFTVYVYSTLCVTSPPLFKNGSHLKTNYFGYSFQASQPLSDQTLPPVTGTKCGPFTLTTRNSGGALTAPVFPPQVVPHRNGNVDGGTTSIVTPLTVGRYIIQFSNPDWAINDFIDVYVELELVPSPVSFVSSPPTWQLGGGTATPGMAYRWYRTTVEPTPAQITGSMSTQINSILTDINTLSSTVVSGFATTTDEFNTLSSAISSGFTLTDAMITSSYVNLSSEIAGIEATLLSSAFTSQVGSAVSVSLSSTLSADIAKDVMADILASNAPLNIVQTNPVVRGVQITLVKGDDYDVSTGQPIVFTDNGTWPNLTGTEVKFSIAYWQNVNSTLVLSCICATAVGPPQTVTVPLSSALTYTLIPGLGYVYDVRAQMPTTHEVRTLVNNGNLLVNEPITTGF